MEDILAVVFLLAVLVVGFGLGFSVGRSRYQDQAARWRELYEAERERSEQLQKRRSPP